jgi:molybdate transport system regulatory protein
MDDKKEMKIKERQQETFQFSDPAAHSRIVFANNQTCLDTVQLNQLEKAFREWAESNLSSDVLSSRKRVLLIFLLIRYTGAKLNEVLTLNPFQDIDFTNRTIVFGKSIAPSDRPSRKVQISVAFSLEIQTALNEPLLKKYLSNLFRVDPGHVRRKFYERAEICGFPKRLGSPDAIRKSRAVELLQNNMPLPVVQKILGHSTPNLTSSFVSFTDEDIQQVTQFFLEKEAGRKTSARNTFFGKIRDIQRGDIQSKVEMVTVGGDSVTTIITNDSLHRLGLKPGRMISAEIKAPLVVLYKAAEEPKCTAENRFQGTIVRVNKGRVTTEYLARIADGTELCSLVSSEFGSLLDLKEADPVWATFSSFSVVLHID